MNYLAHIFLSGDDRRVQIGNFVGDAVKGRAYENYPSGFREGILLHREIDDYTDHHPVVREVIDLLRGDFGRYSGVLADIYFDHLLAKNFRRYSGRSLKWFAFTFYGALLLNYHYLPEQFKNFLWHFILTNRLVRYASLSGIKHSLEIMVEYKNLRINPELAVVFFKNNQGRLQELFDRFLPDVRERCRLVLEMDIIC